MYSSGSEENFKQFTALVLKLLMKNIGNLFVRLFVISLLTFRFFYNCIHFRSRSRPVFYYSGSGSGSEQTVSAAPAPAPAPTKMCRLRRLRLRLRLRIPAFNERSPSGAVLEDDPRLWGRSRRLKMTEQAIIGRSDSCAASVHYRLCNLPFCVT